MPEKSVMGVRSETANSYAELSLETRLMYARCLSGTNGGGAAVEAAVAVDGVAILAGGTVTTLGGHFSWVPLTGGILRTHSGGIYKTGGRW